MELTGPYASQFDNFFLTLRMSRPNFKESARFTYDAVKVADLGGPIPDLLSELQANVDSFDENLEERQVGTEADTVLYRQRRKEVLEFVADTFADYITPKLRKLPAFASFKPLTDKKLKRETQSNLATKFGTFGNLLTEHRVALGLDLPGAPALETQAATLLSNLNLATSERTGTESEIDTNISELTQDWVALAKSLHRLKLNLQLLLEDDPERVYRFFKFDKVRMGKRKEPQPVPVP